MLAKGQQDKHVGLLTHRNRPRVLQLQERACCLLVAEMSDSRRHTMINVTQNEALEALMSEEKYQTRIQLLPPPRPPASGH